ncbi:MAG: endonuclease [Lewinellaceae bacterium]|nr:endonuclease [Lewinellaceae bacterium]
MRLFFALVFFISAHSLSAQFYQAVFPGLSDQELLDALVDTYKPYALVNNYTNDTLYKRIYLEPGDSLRCIYTGYAVYLPPNQDPSQAAFAANINLEHTYPKAMGADVGLAVDDMHHLFPSRADVNNYRGNLPFGEVNDPDADYWFYLDQTQTTIPGTNIDLYSEVINNGMFEPREDKKGNIARAMFYFYTMYKQQADLANNTFFESQRETLCHWHYDDPVDSLEWARTFLIAGYQEGKPNPFVLDCTLPERSYCQGLGLSCNPPSGYDPELNLPFDSFNIHPNPSSSQVRLEYSLREKASVNFELYDALGRLVGHLQEGEKIPGTYVLEWQNPTLASGLYWWKILVTTERGTVSTHRKMILQH